MSVNFRGYVSHLVFYVTLRSLEGEPYRSIEPYVTQPVSQMSLDLVIGAAERYASGRKTSGG